MSRLTATDAMFAYADSPTTPMNMGSVQFLRLPTEDVDAWFETLRSFLVERVSQVPRLSQRLVVDALGLPSWAPVDDIDFDYHIRRTRVRGGSERELARKLGRLQHIPFDFERPLFMFYLIEGLEDGRVVLLHKYHHALADGKTAVRLVDLFSDEGAPWPTGEEEPFDPPGWLRRNVGGVVEDGKRLLQTAGALAGASRALVKTDSRDMLLKLARRPVTHLNGPLSEERQFVSRCWPVEPLHRVRKALGLTFNDIGLVLFGGALRRYLDELDALPDRSLICNVPVAVAGSGSGGNSVLSMWVPLGTDIADPQERAAFVQREAIASKAFLQSVVTASAVGSGMRMPSLMVRAMALPLSSGTLAKLNPPPGNVALSNVPTPATPIHVAGALVESNHGMPMLLQGQAVGGTFTSYAGQVVTGLICCARAVPEPERILDYMLEEQKMLEQRLFATKPRRRSARRVGKGSSPA
ncbi:DUF1298 domain-containing protein [Parahaliea maris]|uniref:diacylglycerol O-acyltransferase n=1 Tax=Parahaliea maris TaxID=2716870 RepID=A0A5C9A3R5_9GAMM|nr:wax ester/triacylglycerol synthase domain-containing protein [Parahaliea maris]TXS95523.1 DUF1298 domain-containing protein [Parahaliea maris]